LADEEILKMINENREMDENNSNVSIIYKDGEVYDEPKKAVYGI
jgi:hypothetical protein